MTKYQDKTNALCPKPKTPSFCRGFRLLLLKQALFGLILVVAALISSCNVTKHLDTDKGERLLTENKIDLVNTDKMSFSKKQDMKYALKGLVRLDPNYRFMSRGPRTKLWLYYRYKDRTGKFARWINKKVAEPPALFSRAVAEGSKKNFENDLRQKGYFDATCTYDTIYKGKYSAKINYTINLGKSYKIGAVNFESKDSLLNSAVQISAPETLLKPNLPLSAELINAEKARVTYEIRNRGYANFTPNFVEFTADTAQKKNDITVELLRLGDSTLHQTYFINNITVLVGVVPEVSQMRRDTTYNGIYFATSEPAFQVYPTRLYESIAMRPGWPYRQIDFDKTARDLNALGVFRFVAIRPVQDSLEPGKINVDIKLTPNQRTSITGDFGLNYSDANSGIARSLIGISPSGSFRNRNLLGGAEVFSSNVDYAIEFNLQDSVNTIFSQEFSFNNQIVFPRFFDYMGIWNLIRKIRFGDRRIVTNSMYRQLKSEGTSRFSLNYNYQQVFQFYKINSASIAFGYDLQSSPLRQYSITHVGIDVLSTVPDSNFIILTRDNEFLRQSFKDQLFTGFLLRTFAFNYAGKTNKSGERINLRFNSDLSGLEIYGINALWNAVTNKDDNFKVGNVLDFAKYLRLDLDAVYTRNFRKQIEAAARIATGVALPFDGTEVPYVKQFSIGGPSSLRAWQIRELGPGGYFDPKAKQPYFQTGDFRLEFNAELRFPLFWWVKGALFADAGNIWTLQNDPRRPNAQLRSDAWKNIAFGAGFGIRLDFDYAILRFDFGLPLRNPYPIGENDYWIKNRISGLKLQSFRPNLAVGYPF